MIGRLARAALVCEALFYLALSLWLTGEGYGGLRIFALLIGTALFLRFIVALGPFLSVLALRLRDGRPVINAGFGKALVGEYFAKSMSFTVWQPFEHWLMLPDPEPGPGRPVPILLVHGYLCNRGSWLVMRRLLCAVLPNPVFTISLEPPFARIDEYVPQLEARVAQILAGSAQQRVHLVCHSMGGLVARAWLARSAGWGRVASLTMLGSPHHGTELARVGVGRNVRQMVRGNAWLDQLDQDEQGLIPPVPVVSIHTENDNLVYPPESADLPWAANIRVEGVGHVQLQSAPAAAAQIVANVRKAEIVR